jgi:hypothetical protein
MVQQRSAGEEGGRGKRAGWAKKSGICKLDDSLIDVDPPGVDSSCVGKCAAPQSVVA